VEPVKSGIAAVAGRKSGGGEKLQVTSSGYRQNHLRAMA
jgi:hypothetical protein